jgi:hypothetical protein
LPFNACLKQNNLALLKHQKEKYLRQSNKTFFNFVKNNPMKLNEIKKIEVIKTEALSNIKGGGRDTRTGETNPTSNIVPPVGK